MMKIDVIFEDDDCLVVNKPVGVVVNRAESIKTETVQDWVEQQTWYPSSSNESKLFQMRSGICHRLDKETSGCLLIAKSGEALTYYLKMFKDRKLKKMYTALVHGKAEPAHGEVVLPIKRSLFDREKWQVHYEGKKSITEWWVKEIFDYPGGEQFKHSLSLLDLSLKTGRTHQIRVHLSFLGWPIYSDDKYLNKKIGIEDRKNLSHHFLHASKIEFTSFFNREVSVEASLPADSVEFLSGLRK